MSEDPIRILIVDDSALYRLLLRDVLRSIPGVAIVGHAENGMHALEQIEALEPELVTLDVEMPDMSGIDVLRELNRRRCPAKAVMVSRFTDAGAQATTDALLEGAFDFICKPSEKSPSANKAWLRRELESKLAAFREARRNLSSPAVESEANVAIESATWKCACVLIGASTGGPEALRVLLPKLPDDFPTPIIVVQHMPRQFTRPLAERLDKMCPLKVVEAEHGMRLHAGTIFIAPGGRQLKPVTKDGGAAIQLTDDPPENNCRPAIDYTLRFACELWAGNVLAVVLTGMGRDGLKGSECLRRRCGRVIAQHVVGCTVFGMPKAIIEAGLADRIVKLPHIASVVCDEVRKRRKPA